MARLSFIEKLSVLFNLTKSSTLYIIILLAIAALGLILVTGSKKSDKTTKIFYVTIYIILVMINTVLIIIALRLMIKNNIIKIKKGRS